MGGKGAIQSADLHLAHAKKQNPHGRQSGEEGMALAKQMHYV